MIIPLSISPVANEQITSVQRGSERGQMFDARVMMSRWSVVVPPAQALLGSTLSTLQALVRLAVVAAGLPATYCRALEQQGSCFCNLLLAGRESCQRDLQ